MHINHVPKRVSNGSYALYSVKRFLSRDNMKTLYYSLIHYHLSYGTLLWGSVFQYRLHQLDVIQNKSVRNICNTMYNAHTGPLFKQLRIPKLVEMYNSQLCKLMYLFTSGTLPSPLQMVFKRNSDVHSYPIELFTTHISLREKKSLFLKILYVPSTCSLVQIACIDQIV